MYRPSISRVIFLGFFLPLQLLFCGSIIYLSSYPLWLQWCSYLNPMHYYLAAFFVNEFKDNTSAIPSSSSHKYDDLESQYGYNTTIVQSFFILLILGYAYKMMWLFSLKYREILSTGSLPLKRVFKAAKKKMKKLMKAGLRFSKKRDDGYTLEEDSIPGDEIEMSDEEERHDAVYDDEQGKNIIKSPKKRGSVGEEMIIREDGLLLFGVMEPSQEMKSPTHIQQQQHQLQLQQQQQQQNQSQSHHSVLNALYRPEYNQTNNSNITNSPTSLYRNTNTLATTKNRIVVSKSSQKNIITGQQNTQSSQNVNNIQNSLRI